MYKLSTINDEYFEKFIDHTIAIITEVGCDSFEKMMQKYLTEESRIMFWKSEVSVKWIDIIEVMLWKKHYSFSQLIPNNIEKYEMFIRNWLLKITVPNIEKLEWEIIFPEKLLKIGDTIEIIKILIDELPPIDIETLPDYIIPFDLSNGDLFSEKCVEFLIRTFDRIPSKYKILPYTRTFESGNTLVTIFLRAGVEVPKYILKYWLDKRHKNNKNILMEYFQEGSEEILKYLELLKNYDALDIDSEGRTAAMYYIYFLKKIPPEKILHDVGVCDNNDFTMEDYWNGANAHVDVPVEIRLNKINIYYITKKCRHISSKIEYQYLLNRTLLCSKCVKSDIENYIKLKIESECPICFETIDKLPKIFIQCGHSICNECYMKCGKCPFGCRDKRIPKIE